MNIKLKNVQIKTCKIITTKAGQRMGVAKCKAGDSIIELVIFPKDIEVIVAREFKRIFFNVRGHFQGKSKKDIFIVSSIKASKMGLKKKTRNK